jgi:hypothetical protein
MAFSEKEREGKKKGMGTLPEGAEVGDCKRADMKLDQIGFWSEIKLEIIKKLLIFGLNWPKIYH